MLFVFEAGLSFSDSVSKEILKTNIKQSDILYMKHIKHLMLALVFFCSCQSQKVEMERPIDVNETERLDLLYLFDDLYGAVSCNERQELIESNKTLQAFGRQYDLPRGYLFDIFSNTAKLKDQSIEKRLVSTISNVWKVSASDRVIQGIMEEVSRCYPGEYLELEYKKSYTSRSRSYRSSSRSSSSTSSSSTSSNTNTDTNTNDPNSFCSRTAEVVTAAMTLLNHDEAETNEYGITKRNINKWNCADITEEDLEELLVFRMHSTNIDTLKSNDLLGFSSLHTLSLTRAGLSRGLPSGLLRDLGSLRTIFLIYNDFSRLPSNLFRGLESLEDLNIFNNDNLSSLPSGIFNGLSSLKTLSLSGNDFSRLPPGIFNSLSSLEYLDLRDNNFSDAEKQRIRSEVDSSVTLHL